MKGKERERAAADKRTMEEFLSTALQADAMAEREKTRNFGVAKAPHRFSKLPSLITKALNLDCEPSSATTAAFLDGRIALSRAELGQWLFDSIRRNKAQDLETLAQVLRSRKKHRHATLKSCIMNCLNDLVRKEGVELDFDNMLINTRFYFDTMDSSITDFQDGGAQYERYLTEWQDGTNGPALLPRHLPTKKALRDATEAAYRGEILTPKEFRVACNQLGLSKLPAQK